MSKKLTKQEVINGFNLIKSNRELPKELAESIDYTMTSYEKNKRNVTMEDLNDLIDFLQSEMAVDFLDLVETVGAEALTNIVENNTKPTPKEDKVVKPLPVKEDKVKEKPVKEIKAKKEEFTHELINTQMLKNFPKEIYSSQLKANMKLRNDLVDIQAVAEEFNKNVDLVLAMYWTKRHLKQYASSYDPMAINPNKPTEFEHDLDLIEITYVNELVATGCSLYTYVPNILRPMDFVIHEDNLRYANGCEFQVYEIVDIEA